MRPGRIDEIFPLTLPNADNRLQILSYYASKCGFSEILANPKILKKIVKKTDGLTGAYLRSVIDRLDAHGLELWEDEINHVLLTAPNISKNKKKKI
jgi:ATP-dependent 26S proteasome regulatory subunit